MSKLIFREYIGVKPSSTTLRDFPTEIINSNISEFHFILGFASEGYNEGGKGNGIFTETWNAEFFGPEKVKRLKVMNPKVKVVISIGGRDVQTRFDPAEEEMWISAAIKSLKEIIQKYKNDGIPSRNIIDGIDINYEHIADKDTSRFSHCLGEVITGLKRDSALNINVVSIAPSERNGSHYRKLFWDYRNSINWVDYQFYNQVRTVPSPAAFVELYNKVAQDYGPNKVLPGVSTDPNDTKNTKISRENFIAGCILLKQNSTLPGVFFWNANDSAVPLPGGKEAFLLECFWQSLAT